MKLFILGILMAAALTGSAQTNASGNCCRYPLRVMGPSAGVNLQPLFDWWKAHGGASPLEPTNNTEDPGTNRPLSAWARVTGERTAAYEDGWIVHARVYFTPNSWTNEWILLRRPPAAEEQQFYYLKSVIAENTEQINTDTTKSAADQKAAEQAAARASAAGTSMMKSDRSVSAGYLQRERRKAAAADAALSDKKQREQSRDEAQKALDAIPSEGGLYKLDVFAMARGRSRTGQLVFDVGDFYTEPQ